MFVTTLALVLAMSTPQALDLLPDTTTFWESGSYPFRTGTTVVLDTVRDLAFVGTGSGVFVVDVSDPTHPVVLSDRIRCGTTVKSMDLDGSRLYVALMPTGSRPDIPRDVEIWDVSFPTSPLRLGGVDLYPGAQCVYAHGDTLLIGAWRSLITYDISDAGHPVRLESLPLWWYPEEIEVRDTLAFVSGSASTPGVAVYDVRLLAHPVFLAQWGAQGSYPGLDVVGNRLYLASSNGPLGGASGLRVYDISDPLNGQLLGEFDTMESGAYRVAVRDTVAVVTYAYNCNNSPWTLKTVSVADPANPRQLGSYGKSCRGVALDGDLAYVAFKNRFDILDLTNPAQPVRTGSVPLAFAGMQVAFSRGMVYSVGGSLAVLDAHSGLDIELVGATDLEGVAVAMVQSGSVALVGVASDTGGWRVDVMDVGDPHSPARLSSVPFGASPCGVAMAETLAYVGTDSGLAVFSLADLGNPIRIGALARSVNGRKLLTRDTLLFASDSGHLLLISVSDPTAPVVIQDTALDLDDFGLKDTFLYVVRLVSPGGFVFSVADPTDVRLLSTFSPRVGPPEAVALNDTLLVLAGPSDLAAFSVAAPDSPVLLGMLSLSDYVYGLALAGDTVYTSLVTRYRLVRRPSGIELEPIGGVEVRPLRVWPSVARSVLNLTGRDEAVLFDASGRRVLRLKSGANDVRGLTPGVYFVREQSQAVGHKPQAVHKVVIAQ